MEDGVWRTIGGRKVFIKKGQSLSDAMKESGKFKKGDKYKNKNGAEIEIDDYTKEGQPQYKDNHGEIRKASDDESLKRILEDNEYEKQIEKDFPYNFSEEVEEQAHMINTRGYDDIDDVIDDFAEEQGITPNEAKYALLKDEFKTRQELYAEAKKDGTYTDAQLNHMESSARDSYSKLLEAQEQLDSFKKDNEKEARKETFESLQEKYGLRDKRNEMTVKQYEDGEIDQQELKEQLRLGREDEETIHKIVENNTGANSKNPQIRKLFEKEESKKVSGTIGGKPLTPEQEAEFTKQAKALEETILRDKETGNTANRMKAIEDQQRYDRLYDRKVNDEGMSKEKFESIYGERPKTGLEDLGKDTEKTSTNNSDYNDELKAQARRRIWAEKTLYEQYNNSDRNGKKELTNNFNKELRKQNELEKKYGKISEEDFKKMQSDIYKEAEEYRKQQQESKSMSDKIREKASGDPAVNLRNADNWNDIHESINNIKDNKIKNYLQKEAKELEDNENGAWKSGEYLAKQYRFYEQDQEKSKSMSDNIREKAYGNKSKANQVLEKIGQDYEKGRTNAINKDAKLHKVPKSITSDLLSTNQSNRIQGVVDLTQYVADQEEWIDISVGRSKDSFTVKDRDGQKININLTDNTYDKINEKIKKHYDKKK